MSNETELRTFMRLETTGRLAWSQVPATLRRSALLRELLEAGLLVRERRGAGKVLTVAVPADFSQFLDGRYPGRHSAQAGNSIDNVQRYRDSKGGAKASIGVVLLRGWGTIRLNGRDFPLGDYTQSFGCMAALKPRLRIKRLCLVENLDCFVRAEQLLGRDWTYAHTYGRLGAETFTELGAEDILHWGDYDYTGLDEFLRMRETFPRTRLFLPPNLDALWQRYATPLKKKAVITRRLRATDHDGVAQVLALLADTNRFLEQQALFVNPQPPDQ